MNEIKTREQTAPQYQWDLTHLFESDEKWRECFNNYKASMKDIKSYEGKLNKDASNLLGGLTAYHISYQTCAKTYVYAKFKLDEDTTNSKYQGMLSSVKTLWADFEAITSFMQPEIISIGLDKINEFITNDNRLETYKHYFNDLFRKQKHVLSHDMEELLKKATAVGEGFSSVFDNAAKTDMTFEKAKDSNGLEHEVTNANYIMLMEHPDRTLRKNVHDSLLGSYAARKNTIAETYNYAVKNSMFQADARKYSSTLEASLFENNIPTGIYTNLINTISESLPIYHRSLKLRKKFLKYDELHTWDMRNPILENAKTFVSYEEAKTMVVEGANALGKEYQAVIKQGFDNGWVDVYENKGKDPGAYCWGAYGTKHPYVLMNYNNTVRDMFTLSHEMGHAAHSYYTYTNQPAVYGGYPTFLAEVASTVNEALLIEHLLNTTTDKEKLSYYLSCFIQNFESTFFRQAMFAEFEMLAHEAAKKGSPLNAESLSKLYKSICTKYYGNEVVLNEKNDYEWSRIPHFYRVFYVYQYSTGFSAAMSLSKKIREEGQPAVDNYLNFLKSGKKDYPINLLKQAGVDMTTSAPIKDALNIFESLLDRLEESL